MYVGCDQDTMKYVDGMSVHSAPIPFADGIRISISMLEGEDLEVQMQMRKMNA